MAKDNGNGGSGPDSPSMEISMNIDTTPILFTDNISMTANADGVVFDVMQRVGPTNQLRIVSRFGMSREHAKRFVGELGKLLINTEGSVQTGKKFES